MATWDDHDFGFNDGGAEFPGKVQSQKDFVDFWDPADSVRRDREGVYDSRIFESYVAGLDLARLLIVRCRSVADQLWAYEQALRAPECGAAFAWLGPHDDRVMRRLAVAAREGRTWGVLWRRPGQQAVATAAPLRLALAPQERRLAVRVIKRRGGDVAQPVLIDVDAETNAKTSVRLDFCGRSANKADEEKSSLTLLSLRSAH